MASVSRDANGTKRVLFTDGDGERRAIRLGKVSVRSAQILRLRVEALIESKMTGIALDSETAAWLAGLPDAMHKRMARVGLAEPRGTDRVAATTIGELLDQFERTATVKAGTAATYRQTIESLRSHLGNQALLCSITPAHADNWRKALQDSKLAAATVAKRVKVARSIFTKAVRWRLIAASPFADLRAGSQCNPDRACYVASETIQAVLDACPDDEWRAIIALARCAGLRTPSETLGLRWCDVNWERSRLTVRSPKTAAHGDGHAVRVVPITPRLRPILLTLFDAAPAGTIHVIGERYRKGCGNLGTHFRRIIAQAGVTPWPRLFHNLRASCATDWCERFPNHVVARWLGHSPLIAAQHYLQTRDAHFDLAAGIDQGGAKSGAPCAQNAAQRLSAPDRTNSHDGENPLCFAGNAQRHANQRQTVQGGLTTPREWAENEMFAVIFVRGFASQNHLSL